ncbi:MAG: bifunctional ADP-heptose synthase [Planctomycetota bacterium]
MNSEYHSLLSRLPSRHVLVIGDVMLDRYVAGDVHRISPEAPVPVVHVNREFCTAGGAANVAMNLASLGLQTELIGRFGHDDAAAELIDLLGTQGVTISDAWGTQETRTIVKTRVVAQKQQVCRFDHEDRAESYALRLQGITRRRLFEAMDRADAVILSDYAKGLVTQELYDVISEHLNREGKLFAVDPKPSRRLQLHQPGLLTPNRKESLQLAGISLAANEPFPSDEVCREIHDRFGPRRLVVTLGGDGMLIIEEGRIVARLPTDAKEVFDVSGAGDTVIAMITAALAAGADLTDAARFANTIAGIVVGKFGTAVPTLAEVVAALDSRQDLITP